MRAGAMNRVEGLTAPLISAAARVTRSFPGIRRERAPPNDADAKSKPMFDPTNFRSHMYFLFVNSATFVLGYMFASWVSTWARRWLSVRLHAGNAALADIAARDSDDTWTRFGVTFFVSTFVFFATWLFVYVAHAPIMAPRAVVKSLSKDAKEVANAESIAKRIEVLRQKLQQGKVARQMVAIVVNTVQLSFNLSWATFVAGPMVDWLTAARYGHIAEVDPGAVGLQLLSQFIISLVIMAVGSILSLVAYGFLGYATESTTSAWTYFRTAAMCAVDSGFNFVNGFVWGNWLSFTVLSWSVTTWFGFTSTVPTDTWQLTTTQVTFARLESCMYITLVLCIARYIVPDSGEREFLARPRDGSGASAPRMKWKHVRRTDRVLSMIRFGFSFAMSFVYAMWFNFGLITEVSRKMFKEDRAVGCNGTVVGDFFPADYSGHTLVGVMVVSTALLLFFGVFVMRGTNVNPPAVPGDINVTDPKYQHAYGVINYLFVFSWAYSWSDWLVSHLVTHMARDWFHAPMTDCAVHNTQHRFATMLLLYGVLFLAYWLTYGLLIQPRSRSIAKWFARTVNRLTGWEITNMNVSGASASASRRGSASDASNKPAQPAPQAPQTPSGNPIFARETAMVSNMARNEQLPEKFNGKPWRAYLYQPNLVFTKEDEQQLGDEYLKVFRKLETKEVVTTTDAVFARLMRDADANRIEELMWYYLDERLNRGDTISVDELLDVHALYDEDTYNEVVERNLSNIGAKFSRTETVSQKDKDFLDIVNGVPV